jgi:glutamate dehydrogenase (NAD(P)+)
LVFFGERPLFKTQAFQAIADKVRRNTERMLEAARAGNLLPRAAAVALAERRLRKAMALRRWS